MAQGIDYFNRGHWLTGIQSRVSLRARWRTFELWRSRAGVAADESSLDVALYSPEGVSHLAATLVFSSLRHVITTPTDGFCVSRAW